MNYSLRARAAFVLNNVLLQKGHADDGIVYYSQGLEANESAKLKSLVYNACRYYVCLEFIVNQLLQKPLANKAQWIKALLIIGLCDMHYHNTPSHAAINETVNALKAQPKFKWAKGLINAVLRNYIRNKEDLLKSLSTDPAQYAHPQWLLDKIKKTYPDTWQDIIIGNNARAPMTLRVNIQKNSREEYLNQLQKNNIAANASSLVNSGIILAEPVDVHQLPDFWQGNVSVQDEAAQLAALYLKLAPNLNVLDACTAPGGKLAHILEIQKDLQSVTAIELKPDRLVQTQKTLERLNLSAHCLLADASKPEAWWDNILYDRILLDAPCSATGVIRRHPDIKLLRNEDQVNALVDTQKELLNGLWPLLKPNGYLLYATCSILPEENSQQIEAFLKHHQDASVEALPHQQLLPTHSHDGFYYALLKKKI